MPGLDPTEVRAAVEVVAGWLRAEPGAPEPSRAELAAAVRGTLQLLAADAPGKTLEVRVPPFAAVQCLSGPRHTRGTPPSTVETDPRTWLTLATGARTWAECVESGDVTASGTRADLSAMLPLLRVRG